MTAMNHKNDVVVKLSFFSLSKSNSWPIDFANNEYEMKMLQLKAAEGMCHRAPHANSVFFLCAFLFFSRLLLIFH